MPNHLAFETSPYLLQHVENPVDWYPWDKEALGRAQREDKPIFLSIGYAACHWCHVMAHESFEDPEIAEIMNEHFVNIKVDREERPDLDSIYMNAVVSMTGQGGWPMSLFLTPDGKPFYGGTYFPPEARYGMPAFREVLIAIARAWQEDRGQIFDVAQKISGQLLESAAWGGRAASLPEPEDLRQAVGSLLSSYDQENGGWGGAPKFPAPMAIEFLLQAGQRGLPEAIKTAVHALKTMQRGGMYDRVGGGFHRYSTDDHWLIPHFEKMLYDNAQLSLVYLHAYQATGIESFRKTCTDTLDFILREMTHPAGGFFSSLDADSEGVEGKFYFWTKAEIQQAIPDPSDQEFFFQVYPKVLKGRANEILFQLPADEEIVAHQIGLSLEDFHRRIDDLHQALFQARSLRVRPHTDYKVLAAWNGLALRSLSAAARSLNRTDYLAAAQKNAGFLLSQLVVDGCLYRSWRDGQARHIAFLEDHAALILALFDLYQADSNPEWFQWSLRLHAEMETAFQDPAGGYFDVRSDQPGLLVRPKDIQDNATPSGNALACLVNLILAEYTGEPDSRTKSEQLLGTFQETFARYPSAFPFWLQALDFAVGPIQQVALLWPADQPAPQNFLTALYTGYKPRTILAASPYPPLPGSPDLLKDRPLIKNAVTAYVCQDFTCQLPAQDLSEFQKQLNLPTVILGD